MNKTKIGLILLSPFMIMCLIVIGEAVFITLDLYITNFLAMPPERQRNLIVAAILFIATITGFIFLVYGLEDELRKIRETEES